MKLYNSVCIRLCTRFFPQFYSSGGTDEQSIELDPHQDVGRWLTLFRSSQTGNDKEKSASNIIIELQGKCSHFLQHRESLHMMLQ